VAFTAWLAGKLPGIERRERLPLQVSQRFLLFQEFAALGVRQLWPDYSQFQAGKLPIEELVA
jgi:hypothetical protein